ncbi:major facilitator superfamily transporter [Favolaschia claudopus]|uniref:Major facilitator superfamily transporter n=1 Tax=Favolaschia claudopus TaxID=2862362 RepID=A0AAW0B432_9AGAR
MSLNKAYAVNTGARSKTATPAQTTGCQQSSKSKLEKENPSLGVRDHANAPPQEEENYPKGAKLALLTIALGLSCFLVALDNTIISTAIPKITDAFNSLQDVGWYGSAYLLTTAGTQLLFGKLYTHFSIKWVYVASIALFEIGTLLCGAAPSSSIFILGRAVAGVGNAGIFSGALVIIANSVPLAKRPLYTGMIGGMGGIGCVTGPIIGGIITDKLSFRYCFYLSLPLGGIALSLVIFLLKIQHSSTRIVTTPNFFQRLLNFDPFGTLVFIPAITSLLLVLQWGGSKYLWTSAPILGLLIAFIILIAIFTAIQIVAQDRATIPPRILLRRSIWSSSLFAFALGGAFIIVTFYLPIWFQVIHGDSAARSGVNTLPVVVALVAGSVVAGGLITLIGYYAPFMILASILTLVGTGILTSLHLSSTLANWMPFEILSVVASLNNIHCFPERKFPATDTLTARLSSPRDQGRKRLTHPRLIVFRRSSSKGILYLVSIYSTTGEKNLIFGPLRSPFPAPFMAPSTDANLRRGSQNLQI